MISEAQQLAEARMLRILSSLKEVRQTWEPQWIDLRDHLLPRHGRGLGGATGQDVNNGAANTSKIYDASPLRSLDDMAAGMQSGLTSPNRPWFKLQFGIPELDDNYEVELWVAEVEQRIYNAFNASDFYNGSHHIYRELGAFGTSAMAIDPAPETIAGIRTRTYTIGEFYVASNVDGDVDVFALDLHYTADAMVSKFGSKAPEQARQAYDKGDVKTTFHVRKILLPYEDWMSPIIGMSKPAEEFVCMYLFEGKPKPETHVLAVEWFDEFPVMAPRWTVVSNNTYGESLCMNLLPDIKRFQVMSKTELAALEKVVNPPVVAPGDLRHTQINSFPGGITFSDSLNDNGAALRPLYEVRPDLAALAERLNRIQLSIREGMFADLFRMMQMSTNSRMTAEEVAERKQEKLLLLGPVIEKLHNDFLSKAIQRTYNILLDQGRLPPRPEIAKDQAPGIVYISILAQAQRMVGLANIESFVAFAGSLVGVDAGVMDNVDLDQALRQYGQRVGIHPSIMRPTKIVEKIRKARADAAQQQQAMQTALGGAQAAKTLSEADLGGNNALNALTRGSLVNP